MQTTKNTDAASENAAAGRHQSLILYHAVRLLRKAALQFPKRFTISQKEVHDATSCDTTLVLT